MGVACMSACAGSARALLAGRKKDGCHFAGRQAAIRSQGYGAQSRTRQARTVEERRQERIGRASEEGDPAGRTEQRKNLLSTSFDAQGVTFPLLPLF